MIPATALAFAKALEAAAMKKPIPIGSIEVIKDAAGRTRIKPKKKHKTLQQQYASKAKRKWRAAK